MHRSKKIKSVSNGLKTPLNKKWCLGLFFTAATLLWSACASVQHPSGGPKDVAAPKVMKESPKNLSTHFNAKEIEVSFDEFIKLTNEFAEVSISPALEVQPELKAQKEKLRIKLDAKLEPNTTYTINFGKAIGDVNEGNILKNYSYVFSTGEVLDSLSVSGNVKSAISNEMLKDATVFLLPIGQDSIFGKRKPAIYAQTDSAGNFKLSNLKAGKYHIYALKEKSADRIYQQGEDEIGFIDSILDLQKNTGDVHFRVFKEQAAKFKVLERKLESDGTILLTFNKGLANISVKEQGGESFLKSGKIEYSLKRDSARIWLPELTFDSLKLGIYNKDALLEKVVIERNKKESFNRTPIITDNVPNNKLKPGSALVFTLSSAITNVDSTKIKLMADSIVVSGWTLRRVADSERRFQLNYPFRLEKKYTLNIAEGAFTNIAGAKTKSYKKVWVGDDPENYGNLSLTLIPSDSNQQYVLQLLDEKQQVLREDIITGKKVLAFTNYPAAKYSIRVVLDENRNGSWDSGNLAKKVQPEKTWTYNKVITLRANWDLEETITLPQDW